MLTANRVVILVEEVFGRFILYSNNHRYFLQPFKSFLHIVATKLPYSLFPQVALLNIDSFTPSISNSSLDFSLGSTRTEVEVEDRLCWHC